MTRFLPAEVIVLVDAGDTAGDLSQRRLRRVYEGALDWLNGSVQGLLQRPPPPSYGSPFEQDMAPVTLRQVCQGAPQVLTPPPVNGRAPALGAPPGLGEAALLLRPRHPGRALAPGHRRGGRAGAGQPGQPAPPGPPLPGARGPPRPSRGGSLAATPHWLAAGTQSYLHRRRPGGPPQSPPAGAGGASTSTTTASTASTAERPGKGDVVVAVLDTSPTLAQVRRAARRYPDNWLLQDLVGPGREFTIDEALSVPGRLLRHLDAFVPSWRGDVRASADGTGWRRERGRPRRTSRLSAT